MSEARPFPRALVLMLSSNGDVGEMGGEEAPEVTTSRTFVWRLVAQASNARGGEFP